MVRAHISGDRDADCTLVVGFTDLLGALKELPDPDAENLARVLPGADLVRVLMEEGGPFGAAAPGVPPSAPFHEQLLGLTDEALEIAEELLEAAAAHFYQEATMPPEVEMLLNRSTLDSYAQPRRRLRLLPETPDPTRPTEEML